MKIEGYKEVTFDEYSDTPNIDKGGMLWDKKDIVHYFKKVKKAQKFPIVFKGKGVREFTIYKTGSLQLWFGDKYPTFLINTDLEALSKAVKKAEEIMKKELSKK